MRVDYKRRRISFYQKEYIPFSGYRYRSEVNMQSFTASYDCQDFSTIMHVVGGENEYGEIITLVPAMPIAVQSFLIAKYAIKDAGDIPHWGDIPEIIYWLEPEQLVGEQTPVIIGAKEYMLNKDQPDSNAYVDELQDITDFCTIVEQVPHLGQFLLDLTYFQKSKLLTTNDYILLTNLFNFSMRNNNI